MAGKTFPVFLAHAQHAILRIWQEAHMFYDTQMSNNYNRDLEYCIDQFSCRTYDICLIKLAYLKQIKS